jgi:hypothetical protein
MVEARRVQKFLEHPFIYTSRLVSTFDAISHIHKAVPEVAPVNLAGAWAAGASFHRCRTPSTRPRSEDTRPHCYGPEIIGRGEAITSVPATAVADSAKIEKSQPSIRVLQFMKLPRQNQG